MMAQQSHYLVCSSSMKADQLDSLDPVQLMVCPRLDYRRIRKDQN